MRLSFIIAHLIGMISMIILIQVFEHMQLPTLGKVFGFVLGYILASNIIGFYEFKALGVKSDKELIKRIDAKLGTSDRERFFKAIALNTCLALCIGCTLISQRFINLGPAMCYAIAFISLRIGILKINHTYGNPFSRI